MPKSADNALESFAPAFLGMRMGRLVDDIIAAGNVLAGEMEIALPVRSMSLITLLAAGDHSVTELAQAVGQTHAAVIKNMKPLEAAGLVTKGSDASDGRRKPWTLTREGRAVAKRLQPLLQAGAAAFEELFSEIGVDLYAAVRRTEAALEQRNMTRRLLEKAARPPG